MLSSMLLFQGWKTLSSIFYPNSMNRIVKSFSGRLIINFSLFFCQQSLFHDNGAERKKRQIYDVVFVVWWFRLKKIQNKKKQIRQAEDEARPPLEDGKLNKVTTSDREGVNFELNLLNMSVYCTHLTIKKLSIPFPLSRSSTSCRHSGNTRRRHSLLNLSCVNANKQTNKQKETASKMKAKQDENEAGLYIFEREGGREREKEKRGGKSVKCQHL